ncbi:DUF349 domain-containing protein [uncultured Corynebacterium sp.]|uniref:DUF349 domain-containing protein n=1 Tax=uncultured Corynebacterium sp. TaxID=159447 RepID=UPI00262D7D50|nr:DUF349 domain-containing protein [uncultured Corynebacterium sp.]
MTTQNLNPDDPRTAAGKPDAPASAPRPTPKPGPRPKPGPARSRAPRRSPAAAKPSISFTLVGAPTIPAASTNPSAFGRADDNGTIFRTTAFGEVEVGSWQAGDPTQGLAHFAQRFDDLRTEVLVLGSRLEAHPEEASTIANQARGIADRLGDEQVVGDLDSVSAYLDFLINATESAHAQAKKAKEERSEKAIARKEELIAEAESIAADSTQWKAAGDRLKAILEEWKTIRGIDRKTDDALWKRYARARDSFRRRRGSHFAELDRNRAAAKKIKEDLVERAEALQDSTDWGETAGKYRELMNEWKAAGRAPRDADNKLWARFRAAQDVFFGNRDAVTRERDEEFEANADAKQVLIDEYDPLIQPDKDLDAARTKLHELQDKWEEIGYVPRNRIREFEQKIAALESRVSNAADDQWRRTDPAAQARADQFSRKVDELNEQADAAEAKGKDAKAKQLRAQAAQWQEWADTASHAVEDR